MTRPDPSAAALPLRTRIGQVNQRLKGWEAVRWVDGAPRVTDVLRREVDRWGGLGAVYGVLRADPWSAVHWGNGVPPERSAEAYAAVQDHVTAYGDGIPVLFVEEAPHGLMALGGTTLPVNLALGAGMDADLTEELAAAVAAEARARGTHVALVSGLDVLRDPRWGRAEECFSEDPALAAALVAATVRGMQGTTSASDSIDAAHVAVVAKHLAGQGAGIGGRNGSGAPVGRRELGEIHLRPAHAAARVGVAGFMAAYNDVDGVPCSANEELLTGTIRERWGWDGVVMADGTAIDRLRDSAPDPARSAALALRAGVDLSLWDEAFTHLGTAIERGLVDEAVLDRAVGRVLGLKRRLGLLGAVGGDAPEDPAPVPARDVVALAGRAARQAVVVVDDDGVLPLRPGQTLAVVGPNADDLDAQLGDYTPPRPTPDPAASTVLTALAARFGADRVRHATGSRLRGPLDGPTGGSGALDEVRAAAGGADVCVAVLGGTSRRTYEDEFADNGAVAGPAPDTTNGEGVDLSSVALPEAQLDVVRAARSAGVPVVAVVLDGRPRALTALRELVDALVVVPFPGPSGARRSLPRCATAPRRDACPRRSPRRTACCPWPTTSGWRRRAGTSTWTCCGGCRSARRCCRTWRCGCAAQSLRPCRQPGWPTVPRCGWSSTSPTPGRSRGPCRCRCMGAGTSPASGHAVGSCSPCGAPPCPPAAPPPYPSTWAWTSSARGRAASPSPPPSPSASGARQNQTRRPTPARSA
nr:glycoside hydrolase family 3 N-terminal domain-containing protein [Promicromonospora thailandica]